MLRDKSLIPLSHQHQHALALCVRIDRALPIPESDLDEWQSEIEQEFRGEIAIHFSAEEQVVFPAAKRFNELASVVENLLVEHVELRRLFARAEDRALNSSELVAFAGKLSNHIRTEERKLFEMLQQLLDATELAELGNHLAIALKDAAHACSVPNPATRLRKK